MKKKIIAILVALPLILSACKKNQVNTETIKNEPTKPAASSQIVDTKENKETPVVAEAPSPVQPPAKTELPAAESTPKAEEPKPEAPKQPVVNSSSSLSTVERDWFYLPKKDGTPSGEPDDVKALIAKYPAYYLGDTSKKYIYLTFDEGYENGYSGKILDILKQNGISAAFFVTTPYINGNKELIKRMVAEGHLVCNHSTTHPSMAKLTDQAAFNKELQGADTAFSNVVGQPIGRFFRPPMGKYSELSLFYTQSLGYKSIFWSFAYNDWDPDNQPTKEYAKKIILERTHNGGIFLLHAVSKTNTEILDELLKEWKSRGFEFKSLTDL